MKNVPFSILSVTLLTLSLGCGSDNTTSVPANPDPRPTSGPATPGSAPAGGAPTGGSVIPPSVPAPPPPKLD